MFALSKREEKSQRVLCILATQGTGMWVCSSANPIQPRPLQWDAEKNDYLVKKKWHFVSHLKANLKIYCRGLILFFPKDLFSSSKTVYIRRRCSGCGRRLKERGVRRCRKKPSSSWCTKPVRPVVFHLQRFLGLLFSSGRLFIDNALQFLQLLHKKLTAKFWKSIGKFSSKVGNKTNVLFYNKPLNYLMTSSVALWMMHYSGESRTSHCKVSHRVDTWYRAMPVPDLLCPPTTKLGQSDSFNRTWPLFTLHFL